jgi:hypothetical protein
MPWLESCGIWPITRTDPASFTASGAALGGAVAAFFERLRFFVESFFAADPTATSPRLLAATGNRSRRLGNPSTSGSQAWDSV